ncbi:MAG: Fe-Mn family superoxide dismutase [Alloscardovia omnicolens]|nr:Fe-Mn family superoxide dismutase [Alloscardovia omnicolens]
MDYVNVKVDYVKAWWNIVNWDHAAETWAKAKGLK